MCTVTYIPDGDKIYLTSNRDEQHTRGIALPPKRMNTLIYPQDKDGGGSWIALKNNGHAAVLLNGAFVPHTVLAGYRKSRGLILLEIIRAATPAAHFSKMNLEGIAPFTMIIVADRHLYECRWDGAQKHLFTPDPQQRHIWSSVTLYDETMIRERVSWFHNWQQEQQVFNTANILDFHHFGGNGDTTTSLVMNRNHKVFTVSITSICIGPSAASLTYQDLQGKKEYQETFSLHTPALNVVARQYVLRSAAWRAALKTAIDARRLSLRQLRIKILHWEYWPFLAVYGPLYPYWLWLSLKARSFFFFSAANPFIRNAGFAMESKKKIYDLMPAVAYPATLFCGVHTVVDDITQALVQNGLRFPLIAKPDIGQRGLQVKLLKTVAELAAYAAESKVDFLIQEYISYENEAGIFYYRMPGSDRGAISGIVGKEFLAIVGDGQSTVAALLQREDRFVLQLPVLRATYGPALYEIPAAGVYLTLVPYGNHSRGAKFTDLTQQVTPALEHAIDRLCRQIPEFYYGRLDIRYKSWEALCEGKAFSVIELNGAGSEPTHIYDPAHSIWFAWKEIIRHWQLMYQISKENATRKGVRLMSTRAGLKMMKEHAAYLKLIS